MRIPALCLAILACVVIGHPPPAVAQVDQQRAQEYFKEAQALCERDGGRLWGVSICAPMVIGDARTQTFATSQPPPDAPRPQLIGLLNGPIQWGDTMWAALSWDTIANWPARTRGEAFAPRIVPHRPASTGIGSADRTDSSGARPRTNIWIPSMDGIGCASNGARSHGRCGNQESCAPRPFATRWPSARLVTRDIPTTSISEHALDINEGLASYTQTVLAAPSAADAIARALELLAERGGRGKLRAHVRLHVRARVWPAARCRVSRLAAKGARQRRSGRAVDARARSATGRGRRGGCRAIRRRRAPRGRRTARAAAAGTDRRVAPAIRRRPGARDAGRRQRLLGFSRRRGDSRRRDRLLRSPIACRDPGARSRRTKGVLDRDRWRHAASAGARARATTRRSPETGGRSRPRRDGWFAKEHGRATTKSSGSSRDGG